MTLRRSFSREARTLARRGYAPTIGLYMLRRFALTLLLVGLGLVGFWLLMDELETVRQVTDKNFPVREALVFGLLKLPDIALQALPFVVLIATLLTLQGLNRHAELVALRAAGLPARRFLLAPMLLVALVGVAAVGVLNPLSATMLKRYEAWRAAELGDVTRGLVTAGGSVWLKQHEGTNGDGRDYFIYGRSISPDGTTLTHATVFVFGPGNTFQMRLDTPTMTLETGQWRLGDTFVLRPGKDIGVESHLVLPTTLTPAMLVSSFNPASTLNVWELRDFIDVLKKTGFPTAAYDMAYLQLLALPALLLAMFALAVPFALRWVRGGGVPVTLGLGLGLGFGYYMLSKSMATLGLAGRMDVGLAAWTPPLIAALVAAALLVGLREE